jgi:hypothetical protein
MDADNNKKIGLWMPSEPELDVVTDGIVMSGRMSVTERREAEVIALLGLTPKTDWEECESVEDYDPVLRWHCRLDREG